LKTAVPAVFPFWAEKTSLVLDNPTLSGKNIPLMLTETSDNILSNLYTMADVLSFCSGMRKEDVYYLEQRGYLHPLKQRHGRLERNLYTREQVELLASVWKHRRMGLPPRQAYDRAIRERRMGQLPLF
jgi:hypothetical protein